MKIKSKYVFGIIVLFVILTSVLITVIYRNDQLNNEKVIKIQQKQQKKIMVKKINFFGDSITEQGKYINTVMKITKASDYINNGDSATSFAIPNGYDDWKGSKPDKNYTRAFCLRAKTMDVAGDLIFIFGGTNDYGKGVKLGNINSIDNTTFYGAVKDTLNTIKSRNPTAKIVLATPTQRDCEIPNGRKNKVGFALIDYVNALKEIGRKYNIPVLDLYNNSCISIKNKDSRGTLIYTKDGLHPNDEGGILIGRDIGNFINSHIINSQ